MLQTLLNDKLWLKLKPIILDLNIYDKPNLRNIFTGILYRLKTGCPWRYLPECFGKYNTVFKTFRRWTKLDKFTKIFKQLIKDPDMEWLWLSRLISSRRLGSASDTFSRYFLSISPARFGYFRLNCSLRAVPAVSSFARAV